MQGLTRAEVDAAKQHDKVQPKIQKNVVQGVELYLNQQLMLMFCFYCLLSLLLYVPLVLLLFLLLELPGAMLSCSGFTVTSHLLDLSKLADALLMSCVQQLVQTPGRMLHLGLSRSSNQLACACSEKQAVKGLTLTMAGSTL